MTPSENNVAESAEDLAIDQEFAAVLEELEQEATDGGTDGDDAFDAGNDNDDSDDDDADPCDEEELEELINELFGDEGVTGDDDGDARDGE